MSKVERAVGIDVSKGLLDVAVLPEGESSSAANDEEGMQTIKNLAHNMAFLLRKLHA